MEMLRGFLSEDCEFYLDGHSEPFTKTDLATWLSESEA